LAIVRAKPCKRAEIIIRKDDLVVVDGKKYHKGCQPTEEERAARAKSYLASP
jgi:hypothetical protein